eukprot:276655-Chlamydomonas_euryale.AAC.1
MLLCGEHVLEVGMRPCLLRARRFVMGGFGGVPRWVALTLLVSEASVPVTGRAVPESVATQVHEGSQPYMSIAAAVPTFAAAAAAGHPAALGRLRDHDRLAVKQRGLVVRIDS